MTPTVGERIALAKLEIRSDVARGIVPPDVAGFSDLHDYVDANYYGGLIDDYDAVSTEEANAVQDALDKWLADGGLRSTYRQLR